MKDEKITCKHCAGANVMKKGTRKLAFGKRQMYLCRDCGRKFSNGTHGHFNPSLVIDAVSKYCTGWSASETSDLIKSKYKISAGNSTILKWVADMKCPYLNIRNEMLRRFGKARAVSKLFRHSGLSYQFKLHKPKLMQFGKFDGLKKFLFSIASGEIDDSVFESDSRCSEQKGKVVVKVDHYENKFLNRFVSMVLKGCSNNKKRHSIVEKFLLCYDRDTVAVEVPVWYWDKLNDKGICGHIDVLQVKFGKVWVLDFKPNAANENVDAVVSQLLHYAMALSFRAAMPIDAIRCSWFDWNYCYIFNPCEVRIQ